MNFRPLCTARVCPTISGTTVERRDQVLMTFLSPARFIVSTFSRSEVSTNGPFLSDLLIGCSAKFVVGSSWSVVRFRARCSVLRTTDCELLLPPVDDELVRGLVVPCLEALRRL